MTPLRRHWLAGLLILCAILTLGLLLWPSGAAGPARPPVTERYTGPNLETRRGGPVMGFALRLSGPAADPQVPPAVEALPVLVGIAGRRAYLRGTDGEVERVSIGQEIDGWRLVAVSARTATLRGPNGDRRVEMFSVPANPAGNGPENPGEVAPPIPGG